jgi:AcrR family transcriptional regulator
VESGQRRRPGEARAEITQAARRLFARRGYQGTSLRLIAQTAHVNEALIFRHFGTKQQLFLDTVVEPFQRFVEEVLARWQHRDTPLTNEDLVALFVGELYDFARENQDVLFAIVSAERFAEDDAGDPSVVSALSAEVRRIAAASSAEAETRDLRDTNFEIVVPCIMAMILGVVLLDPWLFPADTHRPADDEIRAWMIQHAYRAIRKPAGRE